MKKIVISLLLLTLSFRLSAQIDYLEPVKPFTTYTGELGEYYRNVFSLLNTGFQQRPYARFVAIPSFSPEYAMSVEKKNGRCLLIANTLSRTYWQAEKGTVKVENLCEAASEELEKTAELMDKVSRLYDELISYADLYDSANFEAKKMIVNQLIRRVDVYRGYQINISFNFDLTPYIEGE